MDKTVMMKDGVRFFILLAFCISFVVFFSLIKEKPLAMEIDDGAVLDDTPRSDAQLSRPTER